MTDRPRHRPWIVKLGGSLAESPSLCPWLDALAAGGGRLVVVPGGGPFAEAVRTAQKHCTFDDVAAHRMAILAMEQYALMLANLRPGLHPVAERGALLDAVRAGLVPLWLPSRMLAESDVPHSWDVTSDSLAAWLADNLGASCLVLVKSVAPGDRSSVVSLARDGMVDRAFPHFLATCGCECRIFAAPDHAAFSAALLRGVPAGALVLPG